VAVLCETDVMCTELPFPSAKDTAPIPVARVGSHAIMGLMQDTKGTFCFSTRIGECQTPVPRRDLFLFIPEVHPYCISCEKTAGF
jgi:hypothetical protein